MQQYKISVIVPIYNAENYLKNALYSLQEQTLGFNNIEVVLVDDGSTDSSLQIITGYAKEFANVKVLALKHFGSAGAARNEGLKAANSPFVMFLDSDDSYSINACELLYNVISTSTRLDIVAGYYTKVFSGTRPSQEIRAFEYDCEIMRPRDYATAVPLRAGFWTKMYRSSFLKSNQIWFAENTYCEDMYFICNALLNVEYVAYINKNILNYNIRDKENQSVSFSYSLRLAQNTGTIFAKICEKYSEKKCFQFLNRVIRETLDFNIVEFCEVEAYSIEEYEQILKEWQWMFDYMRRQNIRPNSLIVQKLWNYVIFADYFTAANICVQAHSNLVCNESFCPLISVIVPVYKVEQYLHQCVQSILNQTFTDFEIILIDDGSPDNCGQICEDFARTDARVRVVHKENGGLSSARNLGIDLARGEIISFVDSDDWIDEDTFEIALKVMREQKSDIVEYSFRHCYEDKVEEETDCTAEIVNGTGIDGIDGILEWKNFKVIACNKLYKRNIIGDVRFPIGRLHEDEFTIYKFFYAAEKISFVDVSKYNYRHTRTDSITSSFCENNLDACFALRERREFIAEHEELKCIELKADNLYLPIFLDRLNKSFVNNVTGKKLEQVLVMAKEDELYYKNKPVHSIFYEKLQYVNKNGIGALNKKYYSYPVERG